ncbi:MAG: 4Fe-4S ferredoxin, partial [Chloroflexota bacterium]
MEPSPLEVNRRGLVSAAAAAAPVTGAVAFVLGGVARRELQVESPHRLPEFEVRGWDTWYATASRLAPGGAGVIARVIDGRVRKLEGNPLHPLNQGKLCARGQAEVQALYHPDRIPAPLLRTGERGSGNFRPVDWETALVQLSERLAQAAKSGAGSMLFVTGCLRGLRALVVDRLVSALGGRRIIHEPRDDLVLRTAIERVFGLRRLPKFDIANALCILSFGAAFLDSWLSPLQYSVAYGTFRQGRDRPRGYFVHVEPRLSQTGANADEWIPIRPGTEGLLALALAETLVSEGLADAAATAALTSFRAESVAQQTGVPAERIRALARMLAARRPALVLGGDSAAAHTNGLFNLVAIYALNHLLGNVGVPGGVLPNPDPPLDDPSTPAASLRDWQQ